MIANSLTEQLVAWGSVATAVFTLALALMALFAWRTASDALQASRRASEASVATADAAHAANEQSRRDSIAQTRPYVFVELLPGLAGVGTWDLRIVNAGRTPARDLVLSYDNFPDNPDDVAWSVKELFETGRTLPPGCSIRAMWRLEGAFTDGSTNAGLGTTGAIRVEYSSDDQSQPRYNDEFDVMIDRSGLWPVPEEGADGTHLHGDARRFYKLGQALVRRVGELSR